MTRILGIETSCDETAAAVVEDRTRIRSNVVASQVEFHRKYGGVVPEIASRHHVESIGPVIREALERADCGYDDLDALAVTAGPGLVGSLLVGVCAAKALAFQRGLPLVAVNHLEGHIRSAFIEHPQIDYPAVALVVSGGHTSLYLCREEGAYQLAARTRDDAAGEAFDKVAKLLGLGYPGGPVIDRISEGADEKRHEFQLPKMKDRTLAFSFSGLKSAVRRLAQDEGLARERAVGGEASSEVRDLVASFQRAACRALVITTRRLCRREGISTVLVTGGVACNRRLRKMFRDFGAKEGWRVYYPSPPLTTDNAAMIAAAGFLHYERGDFAPPGVNADPNLRL